MISWFIALTCVIIESLGEPSIQFMTAAAVICVVALIFLGIEVINFIIWFFKKLLSTKKRADSMAFGFVFSLLLYLDGKRVSVLPPTGLRLFFRSGFPVQIPLQIVHADMPDRVLHVRAAAEARACDMRREQLRSPSSHRRAVRRKRFGLEHIECGAAEVAVLQSRHQIVRPRQTAASDIDQHRACFHRVQTLRSQQTCGLARVRQTADDDVRPREQSV